MLPCPECDRTFPDEHHLVDHLSDDHEAFDWVRQGRPLAAPGGSDD